MFPNSRISRKACLSFLLGLLTVGGVVATIVTGSRLVFLASGVCFFLALGVGLRADWQIDRSSGGLRGGGLAKVGICLALGGFLVTFVTASESLRWAAVRVSATNNLQQIGKALHAYHDKHGHFPPAALRDKEGRPLLSWRVLLLPYLEQQKLYQQFRLDEPWDSPHNIKLLQQMPTIYRQPPGPSDEPDSTYYQVFTGKEAVFSEVPPTREQIDAADGCANTLLVVEAKKAVPWTKPADLPYKADRPFPALGNFWQQERFLDRKGRFLALFADGSVRAFFTDTDERLIRPLITWKGGEAVDWQELEPWCPGPQGKATYQPRKQ
jgi:hypothetical protein